MIRQRGARTRFVVASAAFVAALAPIGAPASASAATSSAATSVAAAFPDSSFRFKNPSQQGRCATPATPSYVGPLSLQVCDTLDQFFFALDQGANTELLPTWQPVGQPAKCLVADTSNRVSTKVCSGASNRYWQRVNKTLRNTGTGKCLSGNNAGAVYTAVCDGAINRDWELPTSILDSGAVHAAREARRAELAGTAG